MSADPRLEKIDQLFTQWAKSDSPGCALALMHEGRVVYRQGYGMANLEYHIPITPDTIFHVASVSKQFAAAAVLLLEQDGLLSVRDDIRKYVPELHDFGVTITIDHLIHHTSGLRDQWELLIAAGWRMEDVITTDDILSLLYSQRELNFTPGAEYLYCNSGYTLLGLIVERVSGKTLREFCAARIFEPLGMLHTHFHDNYQELVPNRAYSYWQTDEGEFRHAHLLYSTVGATSLFTTVDDLLRWAGNFFTPMVGGQAFIDRMLTHGRLNDGDEIPYASGLVVREYRGLKTVDHSGGDAGYRTFLIHFPDQQFAVVVLANLGSISPGTLALRAADIWLEEHLQADPEQPIALDEDSLKAYVGYYYNAAAQDTINLTYDDALKLWDWLSLEALDSTAFRAVNSPSLRVRFVQLDDTGTPARLEFDPGDGRIKVYERLAPLTLDESVLATYAGDYFCPELDVTYTFAVEEGALCLKRRKYGSIPLLPTFTDGFFAEKSGSEILFIRDGAGQVSGLKLAAGRIRAVNFVRR